MEHFEALNASVQTLGENVKELIDNIRTIAATIDGLRESSQIKSVATDGDVEKIKHEIGNIKMKF